ncbi:MAG: hypothetical protein IJ948_00110 [Clostridia bacterium]|nr:hypothetical protein [Clostridia bacterium]
MKITIIGGDSRLITVKSRLENMGFSVDTLGLFENDKADISSSEVLVLPVPTTRDGINVYTPLTGREIPLKDIENSVSPDTTLLCCNYEFKKGKSIDYNRLDSYALLNAIPTAEGAIKLAIENTDFTLWNSKVLVIGYGRVGKILADRLKGMGAKVTVSARKSSDFALISSLNMEKIHTETLNDQILDYDIIFNTVDFPVISNKGLENTPCKCIIDLSSKGGFNLDFALSRGINAIKAPSLPLKVAPKTAGEFLAQTIALLIPTFD